MKKILVIVLTLIVLSCDQEEFTGTGLESLRSFNLTPVEGSRVDLSSVDLEGEIVVTWSAARSGFDSEVVYTWMLDERDGDFSDPIFSTISDQDGLSNTVTFTNKQLDDLLLGLGLGIGEEIEAQWTVSATNGDVTTVADAAVITIKRVVNDISTFNLISPENQSTVELDIRNPDTQVVIDWDSAFAGFGDEVTYVWLADEVGGNFDDPLLELISDDSGLDHKLTLSHQALEDALANLGFQVGETATIDWKVIASGAELERSSNTYTLSIRRFNPIVAPENLFLVGGSTSAGWSPGASVPFVKTGDGTFEIYSYLEIAGDGFKLLEIQDWPGDWGQSPGNPGALAQDGEENITVSEDAFYRVTVDFNEGTFSVDKMEWSIIGSATPNGWNDPDTNMTHSGNKGDYQWTINVTLTAGELKFRANDSWDVNFGDDGADGSLEYGAPNIPVSAGTYTLTLDLDPVNGYSYTLN